MAGLPGLPPPGFSESSQEKRPLAGLPPPGFSGSFLGDDASPEVAAGRSMIGGFSKLLPFGLGDEIVAGGAALSEQLPGFLGGTGRGLSEAYDSRLNEVRGYQKGFDEAAGDSGAKLATEMGGSLLMPLGLLGKTFSKSKGVAPALGNIAKSAGIGGGFGAAYGFGEGEGAANRLDKAKTGLAIGGITGGVLGAAGETLSGAVNTLPGKLKSTGEALDRFSVGATPGSYKVSAQNISPWEFAGGQAPESAVKKALNSVLRSKVLGKARDPETMVKIANEEVVNLSKNLDKALKTADEY